MNRSDSSSDTRESTRCGLFYGIMPNAQDTFCDRKKGHSGPCRLPLAVAYLERENERLEAERGSSDTWLTVDIDRAIEDAMVLREESASNDGLAAGLVETLTTIRACVVAGSSDTWLTEALAGLDDVIAWVAEYYPKAMREMPRDVFVRIAQAGAALAAARADAPQERQS